MASKDIILVGQKMKFLTLTPLLLHKAKVLHHHITEVKKLHCSVFTLCQKMGLAIVKKLKSVLLQMVH